MEEFEVWVIDGELRRIRSPDDVAANVETSPRPAIDSGTATDLDHSLADGRPDATDHFRCSTCIATRTVHCTG